MSTFKSFEEIDAWQKARIFTREIYKICRHGLLAQDYDLRSQIKRASVSIMSNIAEGFERGGSKEFKQFLAVSKGSAGEVKSHLYVALDQEFIDKEKFDHLAEMIDEISRMLGGLIRYLNKTKIKGTKYKEN